MGLRLQETEFGRNCEIASNVQGEDEGATRGSGKLAAQTAHIALGTSPEAEVGTFRLHFEQVHRITIMRTVLMGRNRASLHNEWILGIQEIAIGPTVAHKTVRFLTSISYSVFARR